MTVTKEDIDAITREISDLHERSRVLTAKRLEMMTELSPVKVGSQIRSTRIYGSTSGRIGTVTRVQFTAWGSLLDRPRVTAKFPKKDGTLGEREHDLWDTYELVEG